MLCVFSAFQKWNSLTPYFHTCFEVGLFNNQTKCHSVKYQIISVMIVKFYKWQCRFLSFSQNGVLRKHILDVAGLHAKWIENHQCWEKKKRKLAFDIFNKFCPKSCENIQLQHPNKCSLKLEGHSAERIPLPDQPQIFFVPILNPDRYHPMLPSQFARSQRL